MISNIEVGAETVLNHLGLNSDWQWKSKILSETPGYRVVTHYHFREVSKNRYLSEIETVGKFFSDPDTGEHCYNAMSSIHRLLAKQDNPLLAIPEPIHYSPENKLLLLKWVDYRHYPELIDSQNYRHYLRLAGKALAYFHQLPVEYGQVKNIEDHLSELINPHPLQLAKLLPELAGRVHIIVEKLRQIERIQLKDTIPMPLHRDFHLRQLFCDEKKVWLIDWDMYSLGDPALDVGNFLVYLATRLPAKSKSAVKAFLEGYRSLMPDIDEANINFYQALTYLRLACKAYRLQLQNWEARLCLYLAQCEQLLSRGRLVQ